jgi:hypothetical protein|tara:strand:- start:102 stop:248 length:147 start_codon:yes stop_codon:yes gene_type:complete
MEMPNQKMAPESQEEININELWKEYEKIAMYFNDLLIKLRGQSLAMVA